MKENKFEPTVCPICGLYEFVDDTEQEKNSFDYQGHKGDQCSHCGWIYDFDQLHNHELKNGNNVLSVSEYKLWFEEKIKKDPSYDYTDETCEPIPHMCPVCKRYKFSDVASFEVCPICGWEDDGISEDEPNKWTGNANDLCLTVFKKRYEDLVSANPEYKYSKDGIPSK